MSEVNNSTKQFTLGEIATVITGICYSKKDPCAKELLSWISGQPASEFTWMMPEPNRITYCREWLLQTIKSLPAFDAYTEEGRHALETEIFGVSPHPNFPEPKAND